MVGRGGVDIEAAMLTPSVKSASSKSSVFHSHMNV